jgi:hypothetical protein
VPEFDIIPVEAHQNAASVVITTLYPLEEIVLDESRFGVALDFDFGTSEGRIRQNLISDGIIGTASRTRGLDNP